MSTTAATRTTDAAESGGWLSRRPAHGYALAFWLLSLAVFRQPLSSLASLSFHDERASHVLLIPLISTILIFLQRREIFRFPSYCPWIGVPAILIAGLVRFTVPYSVGRLTHPDQLSVQTLLIVLAWIGIFILFYGMLSFRTAAFPLLFLLLMIPIPVSWVDSAVHVLQKYSADTCDMLFRLVGVPMIRHGFEFSLPGVDIAVAEECSGIHSALALLIAGLLLQYFFLRAAWKKVLFVLCIVPVAVFKNGVRIVTIAWLGIHVNPDFFHGQLHRQGGLPFSVLALAILSLVLWLLRERRLESRLF